MPCTQLSYQVCQLSFLLTAAPYSRFAMRFTIITAVLSLAAVGFANPIPAQVQGIFSVPKLESMSTDLNAAQLDARDPSFLSKIVKIFSKGSGKADDAAPKFNVSRPSLSFSLLAPLCFALRGLTVLLKIFSHLDGRIHLSHFQGLLSRSPILCQSLRSHLFPFRCRLMESRYSLRF